MSTTLVKRVVDEDSGLSEARSGCKKVKIDFKDDVTVLVGPKEERFVAHKSLLCAEPGFFRDALSKDWKEGKEKIVNLPEQSPGAFQLYLQYLYSGTIELESDQESRDTSEDIGQEWLHVVQLLVESYVLGDMLRNDGFCNNALDAWLLYVNEAGRKGSWPGWSEYVKQCMQLPEENKMLLAIIHDIAYSGRGVDLTDLPDSVCRLVAEVAVAEMKKDLKEKRIGRRPVCEYHIHRETASETALCGKIWRDVLQSMRKTSPPAVT